jgi:hypothetical protein
MLEAVVAHSRLRQVCWLVVISRATLLDLDHVVRFKLLFSELVLFVQGYANCNTLDWPTVPEGLGLHKPD